MDNDLVGTLSN